MVAFGYVWLYDPSYENMRCYIAIAVSGITLLEIVRLNNNSISSFFFD